MPKNVVLTCKKVTDPNFVELDFKVQSSSTSKCLILLLSSLKTLGMWSPTPIGAPFYLKNTYLNFLGLIF